MRHLGDITAINGATAPPVNVIIGGSPCQDLSIAGKRKGLDGERSGLFMEQLRIIKEMRKADADRGRAGKDIRPRFMVWENVPGAFSSNKGEDFGVVLQETIKVVCKEAPVIPKPKNGWPTSGCLTDMGGQWSLAWRVLDAQFWGVPQRRRRIALIADFGGSSAPEILFERESVQGYSETRGTPWEGTTANAQKGVMGNDRVLAGKGGGLTPCTLKIRSGCEGGGKGALIQEDKSATLSTLQDQTLFQPMDVDCRNGNLSETATPIQAAMNHSLNAGGVVACMATQQGGAEIRTDDMAPTLTAAAGMSGNNQPVICIQGNCIDRADTAGCNGKGWTEDVSYTLNTIDRPAVALSVPMGADLYNGNLTGNVAASLTTASGQGAINSGPSVIAIENHPNDSRVKLSEDNVVQTLSGRMGTGGGNTPMILECYSQDAYDKYTKNDASATLKNTGGVYGGEVYSMTTGDYMTVSKDQTSTLLARDYKDPQCVTYQQVTGSLMANSHPGSYTGQDANNDMLVAGIEDQHYIVRRLTPLECERLQGFPDYWTAIGKWVDSKGKTKDSTDSARYKALGNSIAIPPWFYVLRKLSLSLLWLRSHNGESL